MAPSSTFFRLPAEKRETLLRSARAEFARVAYPEASINRIIREAGIPRGSFYMYFTDKADLFSHLLEEYASRFTDLVVGLLEQRGGDLFAAFRDLFDAVQEHYRAGGQEGSLEEITAILRRNVGLPNTMALGHAQGKKVLGHILSRVDAGGLLTPREGDESDILHILLIVTVPLICESLTLEDPAPLRAKYKNFLEILARGMKGPRPPSPGPGAALRGETRVPTPSAAHAAGGRRAVSQT